MTDERTFTAAEILAALHEEWEWGKDALRLNKIKPAEEAGAAGALLGVTKRLGIEEAYVNNTSPITAGE